jgi:hypothetical protein
MLMMLRIFHGCIPSWEIHMASFLPIQASVRRVASFETEDVIVRHHIHRVAPLHITVYAGIKWPHPFSSTKSGKVNNLQHIYLAISCTGKYLSKHVAHKYLRQTLSYYRIHTLCRQAAATPKSYLHTE